ncbi:MAG: efflux RND transporter periplasmic adaptor subunit, partial [Steroidobacteraceae bacterium]
MTSIAGPKVRRVRGGLAAGLVACALLAACGRGTGEAPEAQASLTVTAGQIESRSIVRDVVASGSVAPWQEMSLGVEVAGLRVERVLVEVGDQVKAGQALLQLDTRTLQVDLRRAEAGHAQARANLDLATASATRGETLLASRLISQSNFDELRSARAAAEAQLQSAAAERDAARLRLSYATLRAPDAGVISARMIQPGQIVASGVELLRLIRRGRLEWRAELAETDLVRVKPGASVWVQAPDGTDVAGTVRAISPALDTGSRTALIYADLPDPGALRAGMFAEGRIVLGRVDARVLPREAVVVRDGYRYVFVLGEDSRVRQRRVEASPATADVVPILAGVK